MAAAVVATVALAVVGWALVDQSSSPVALAQEGVFTPGLEVKMVPRGGRNQALAQVAMGTHGGKDGLNPMPPPTPPTWARGGNTYVYDGIYGIGQRPTTGVWASGGVMPDSGAEAEGEKEAASQEEEEAEPSAQVEEAGAPAAAEEEEEEAPQAAAQEEEEAPAAAEEEPEEEEVQEPNGETEEEPVEQEEEEQPEEEEEEPAQQEEEEQEEPEQQEEEEEEPEEECDGQGCTGGKVVVNMPQQPQVLPQVQQVPVPYPAAASQQLPMEWAAEDAAEHAYNLAQWRVKILRAKMDQAKLRKQLMALSMGDDAAPSSALSEEPEEPEERGRDEGRDEEELKSMKQSLLNLAQETVGAIKQLKNQMQQLRAAACCKEEEKGPTTQLSQTSGGGVQQQLAAIKAKKATEVKNLKKRMDKQMDHLLTKVTKLIQDKRRS